MHKLIELFNSENENLSRELSICNDKTFFYKKQYFVYELNDIVIKICF